MCDFVELTDVFGEHWHTIGILFGILSAQAIAF